MAWEFPLSAEENYVRYLRRCQHDRYKSDVRRAANQWRKTYVTALIDARRHGLKHLQQVVSDRVRLSLPIEKRTSERVLRSIVASWAWDWPLSRRDIAYRDYGAELDCEDESERLLEKEQAVILCAMEELRKVGLQEKKLLKILANRRHHKHGMFDSSEIDVVPDAHVPPPQGAVTSHFQTRPAPQRTDTSDVCDDVIDTSGDALVIQACPTPQRANISCVCGRVLNINNDQNRAKNAQVRPLVSQHGDPLNGALNDEVHPTRGPVPEHKNDVIFLDDIFLDAQEEEWRDLPGAQTRVPIPEHDVIFHDALEYEWYDLPDVQTRVPIPEHDLIFHDTVEDEWYDLPEVYTRPALLCAQWPTAVREEWHDLPDDEEEEDGEDEEEEDEEDEEEEDEEEEEEVEEVEEEEECYARPRFMSDEDDDSAVSCSPDDEDGETTDDNECDHNVPDATFMNQDAVWREKCMLAACRRQKRSYTLSAESTQASIAGSLPATPRQGVPFLKRKKKSIGFRHHRFSRIGATMHDTPRVVMVDRCTQANFEEPEIPLEKPQALRSRSWVYWCAPFLTLVSFGFSVFIIYLIAFDPLPPSSNFV